MTSLAHSKERRNDSGYEKMLSYLDGVMPGTVCPECNGEMKYTGKTGDR